MGYQDAIRDGVKHKTDCFGDTWYYPKCHKCGAEVPSLIYRSGTKYTCKRCRMEDRLIVEDIRKAEKAEERFAKLEKAIDRIKARYDISKYESAIENARQMIDNGGHVFDSTEEIMVALILFKNNIPFRHQVRFGKRYTADFVLDDMKVVLEVDGDIFHGKDREYKQQIRDDLIIAALGPSWEIIRIKTSTLNQNISRLPKAIEAVVKKREMYRRLNKGLLPDWYNVEG